MIDLVGKRKLWYLISLIIIVPGMLSLVIHGLDLGIDFTGGTSWELQFETNIKSDDVREVLAANGYPDTVVQISDGNTALIRMKEL